MGTRRVRASPRKSVLTAMARGAAPSTTGRGRAPVAGVQLRHQLVASRVSIFVRRGGPNYQEGLRMMRTLGESLGVPIYVHGPEMFITGIGASAQHALVAALSPAR